MPDTPPRPTLPQRVALWILGALMFYIVALYPNLLMARFQPDDVVHYGFLKWMAVVLILYGVASQLFFAERPVDTRPGRQTLAATAAILLVIGIFSPIVSFSFVGEVDFFREGYGDGYILLIMAVASLALAVTGRWKQVLVPALGGLAVILWTFLGVQDTISTARSGGAPVLAGNPHEGLAPATMASIQWEWGWILLFAGSGLLVYAAARRDRAEEAPPWSTDADYDEQPVAADATAEVEAGDGEATAAEAAPGPAEAAAEETAEAGTAEAGAAPATGESGGTAADSAAAEAAESAADADAAPAAETIAGADASGDESAAATTADAAAETETASAEKTAEAAEAPAAEEPATAEPDAGATEPVAEKPDGAAATATEDATPSESAPAAEDAKESGSETATGAAESSAEETRSAPAETAGDETKGPEASASKPAGDPKGE